MAGADLNYYPAGTPSASYNGQTLNTGKATPDAIMITRLNPVVGIYIAKRTARTYYVAA